MNRKKTHKFDMHQCLLDIEENSKIMKKQGVFYLYTYNQFGRGKTLPIKFCPICGEKSEGEQKANSE